MSLFPFWRRDKIHMKLDQKKLIEHRLPDIDKISEDIRYSNQYPNYRLIIWALSTKMKQNEWKPYLKNFILYNIDDQEIRSGNNKWCKFVKSLSLRHCIKSTINQAYQDHISIII